MVAHVCNLSTWAKEAGETEASLALIACSKTGDCLTHTKKTFTIPRITTNIFQTCIKINNSNIFLRVQKKFIIDMFLHWIYLIGFNFHHKNFLKICRSEYDWWYGKHFSWGEMHQNAQRSQKVQSQGMEKRFWNCGSMSSIEELLTWKEIEETLIKRFGIYYH